MLNKIKIFVLSHKIISLIFIIILVVLGYRFISSNKKNITSYVTENVQKGTIMSTVTGIGQVESSDTVDLKSGTTGEITYVGVKEGQEVKAGDLIATIDSRDAKIALENAKISLEDLTQAPDKLDILQKKNTLEKSYNDAWDLASSSITKMDSVIYGLDDLYLNYLGYKNISSLGVVGKEKYNEAQKAYYESKKSLSDLDDFYKKLSATSSKDEIKNLLNESLSSAKLLTSAVKDSQTVLSYVISSKDAEGKTDAVNAQNDLSSWLATSNGLVSSFLSVQNNIISNTQALEDLIEGASDIDIKSAKLNVESKQNAYNDCFIRAPFDGIVSNLTAKVGESSGSSVGTLITRQKVAVISLNEVDIANIKVDQKATLTFDAIEGLSIVGRVSQIDTVGTVNSGVVNYDVKISFDDNNKIKPGMSVNASIVTGVSQDVLTISNSALKSDNKNGYYVEILNPNTNLPVKKNIKVGLSNDIKTEIVSGLDEGNKVITKTVNGNNSKNSISTQSSKSNILGGSSMRGAREFMH